MNNDDTVPFSFENDDLNIEENNTVQNNHFNIENTALNPEDQGKRTIKLF